MSHGATQPQVQTRAASRRCCVAPIISEKATRIGEKQNQVLFKVLRDATKPEIKAAVELMLQGSRSTRCVTVINQKGKVKRFGRSHRPPRPRQEGVCVVEAEGQELNFSGESA